MVSTLRHRKIHLQVREDMHEKLTLLAASVRVSKSDIVRMALVEYFLKYANTITKRAQHGSDPELEAFLNEYNIPLPPQLRSME